MSEFPGHLPKHIKRKPQVYVVVRVLPFRIVKLLQSSQKMIVFPFIGFSIHTQLFGTF